MRFQQLKHDPNAVMRKKLYKSGKNWVVMSTLTFVGGLAMLGMGATSVQADAVDSSTGNQDNTEVVQGSNRSSSGSGTETPTTTDDSSQVTDQSLNEDKQNTENEQTNTSTNTTVGEQQNKDNTGVEPQQNVPSSGTDAVNETKDAQLAPTDNVKPKAENEPVDAENIDIADSTTASDTTNDTQTISDSSAFTIPSNIAADHQGKFFIDDGTNQGIDLGTGSQWYLDTDGTLYIGPGIVANPTVDGSQGSTWNAYSYNDDIKKAVFEKGTVAGTSLQSYFNSLKNLESVDINNLDVSKTKFFNGMFSNTSKLKSLDLSGWKNMLAGSSFTYMFSNSGVTNVNISGFNLNGPLDDGTNIYGIFRYDEQLTNVELPNTTPQNVSNAGAAFQGDNALESIDLSNFYFVSDNDSQMFDGTNNLRKLKLNSDMVLYGVSLSQTFTKVKNENGEDKVYTVRNFNGWTDGNNQISNKELNGIYSAGSTDTRKGGIVTWTAIDVQVSYEIHYFDAETNNPLKVGGKDYVVTGIAPSGSPIPLDVNIPGYSKTGVLSDGSVTTLSTGTATNPQIINLKVPTVVKQKLTVYEAEEPETLVDSHFADLEYNNADNNTAAVSKVTGELEKNRKLDLDNTSFDMEVGGNALNHKLSDKFNDTDFTWNQMLEAQIDGSDSPSASLPSSTTGAYLVNNLVQMFEELENQDPSSLSNDRLVVTLVYLSNKVNYTLNYQSEDGEQLTSASVPVSVSATGIIGSNITVPTIGELVRDGKLKAKIPGYAVNIVNIDSDSQVLKDGVVDYYVTVPKTLSKYFLQYEIIQRDENTGKVIQTQWVDFPMYGEAAHVSKGCFDIDNYQLDKDKSTVNLHDGGGDHNLSSVVTSNTNSALESMFNLGIDGNNTWSLEQNDYDTVASTPYIYTFDIAYKEQVGYNVNYVGTDGKTILYSDSNKQVGNVGDPVKIDTLANLNQIRPGYAATSVGVAPEIVSGQDTYDVQVPTVNDYYKLTINGKDADGKDISTSISIPRYGSVDDTTVQNAVADLSSEHIDLSNLQLNNETISNPASLDSYIKDLIAKENTASTDLAKNASATTDTQPTVSQTLDVGYKEQVTYKVNYLGADGETVLYTTSNTGYVGDPVVADTLANLKQVKPGYAANKIGDVGTITSETTYDVTVPTTNDYYDLTINGRDANNKTASATISVPKYGSADDASVKDSIARVSGTDIDWANTKLGDATVASASDLTSYIDSLISEQNQNSSKLSYDSDDLPTTSQTLNLAYLAPKVDYTINYVSSNDPTKVLYSETGQSGRVGDKVDVPTISQLVQNGALKNKVAGYSADSPASITLTSDNNYDVKVPTVADYLTLNISQTDSDKKPLATVSTNVPMYGQASTDVAGLSDKKVDWDNSKVSGNFKLNDGTSVDGMTLSNLASKLGLSIDSASLNDLVKAVLTEVNTTSNSFAKDNTADDTKAGNTLNLDVTYKADESNNSDSNTGSNTDNSDNNTDDSDTGTIVKKPQDIATTGQIVTLYNKQGDIVRNRALGTNTAWYSDEIYTFKGEKYYRVATDEFAKVDAVYAYEPMKKSDIRVYNDQIGNLVDDLGDPIKNRSLASSSEWVTDRYAIIKGEKYYRVATGEFAKLDQVYKYESIKQNVKTNRTVPVYNERGVKLNITLPANISYTADMIVTINGVSYYRIADDEFVKKSDVLPN
ncbi:SLAP domain-containing protein [Companilactobacillus hulinensis]|uniref:SLAP domain-containing protein n=1 Tax=Companilactobacillus hulinensis TaxID=2486007 RepID=UPI000F77B393|nr:SLAP domain-containing protein [Companilactobacillus hulinensis]